MPDTLQLSAIAVLLPSAVKQTLAPPPEPQPSLALDCTELATELATELLDDEMTEDELREEELKALEELSELEEIIDELLEAIELEATEEELIPDEPSLGIEHSLVVLAGLGSTPKVAVLQTKLPLNTL